MAHNCIDWTATPPTRKIPLLILTRGDDRVYTIVPKDLKTLEEIARTEFNLGNVDVAFSSACLNLCGGEPARITESAWENLSPYIGCATVEVTGPRLVEDQPPQEQPPRPEILVDEPDAGVNSFNTDKGNESDRGIASRSNAFAREARDEQDVPSDHAADHDRPFTTDDQHEEPADEEEVSVILPRKSRHRRVVSEADDEGDDSEGERYVPARSQASAVDSPPKLAGNEIGQERQSDYRSEPEAQPAEQRNKSITQERRDTGSASHSQAQTQSETRPQESGESHKLMIRVAHRPSKQESKFTTKSTTRVAKVLAGACKSFGLDPNRATLYLIVLTEDEDGEVDNLFPCDKNDTIARAGAERDTESRFLLKMAGEA